MRPRAARRLSIHDATNGAWSAANRRSSACAHAAAGMPSFASAAGGEDRRSSCWGSPDVAEKAAGVPEASTANACAALTRLLRGAASSSSVGGATNARRTIEFITVADTSRPSQLSSRLARLDMDTRRTQRAPGAPTNESRGSEGDGHTVRPAAGGRP